MRKALTEAKREPRKKPNGWNKCSDIEPPPGQYLVFGPDGIDSAVRGMGKWFCGGYIIWPTHWRTMPDPPTE